MTYHARVVDGGDVVLPAAMARALDIENGDALVVVQEDGRVILKTFRQIVKESQTEFRAMMPAGSEGDLVDELIADRRAEAARDDAEQEDVGKANKDRCTGEAVVTPFPSPAKAGAH